MSCPQDGDGWVSHEDLRLAKRFDFDGNGVIDPEERAIAKHVIAHEFFTANRNNLNLFGEQVAKCSVDENVQRLAGSVNFEHTLGRLKEAQEALHNSSSLHLRQCMELPNKALTRQNYYTDKMDTSAWNSFEGVPSFAAGTLATQGSRRALLEARKLAARAESVDRFDSVVLRNSVPRHRFAKVALISDVRLEN